MQEMSQGEKGGVGVNEAKDMVRVEKDGLQIKARLLGKDQASLCTYCWDLKKRGEAKI